MIDSFAFNFVNVKLPPFGICQAVMAEHTKLCFYLCQARMELGGLIGAVDVALADGLLGNALLKG